ncbi:MAG: chemotaxis protein CheB [Asticcacaulis sp.]
MTGSFAPTAVVIGASAGGLKALSDILPHLPADYPLPIMVVVHIPPDKPSLIASLFDDKCAMVVSEAEDKEMIEGGHIYFAAPDYHLLVEKEGCLSLSADEEVLYSRPSIDLLFESAADAYGAGLIGIILSGANEDGAAGLRRIVSEGGRVLVQTPETAMAQAMPEAALKACPSALSLSPSELLAELKEAGDSCLNA